ncbi:unnamed protein product, partial [Chrysoparadoxa australica]
MAMPELEREALLAERAEKQVSRQETKALRHRIKQSKVVKGKGRKGAARTAAAKRNRGPASGNSSDSSSDGVTMTRKPRGRGNADSDFSDSSRDSRSRSRSSSSESDSDSDRGQRRQRRRGGSSSSGSESDSGSSGSDRRQRRQRRRRRRSDSSSSEESSDEEAARRGRGSNRRSSKAKAKRRGGGGRGRASQSSDSRSSGSESPVRKGRGKGKALGGSSSSSPEKKNGSWGRTPQARGREEGWSGAGGDREPGAKGGEASSGWAGAKPSSPLRGVGDDEEWSEGMLTLDDVNKCRVPRQYLEMWVNEPFFATAVDGCFVKFGIGNRKGHAVYRMCLVVGVKEHKRQYKFGGGVTTKALLLKIGNSTKECRMDTVSNRRITPQEFSQWKATCRATDEPLITHDECEERRLKMKKVVDGHQYTTAEVQSMVQRREKVGQNLKNIALSKMKLERELSVAERQIEERKSSQSQDPSEEPDLLLSQVLMMLISHLTWTSLSLSLSLLRMMPTIHCVVCLGHVWQEEREKREREEEAHIENLRARLDKVNNAEAERMKSYEVAAKKMRDLNKKNQKYNTVAKANAAKVKGAEKGGEEAFDPFARRACRPKILWAVGNNSPTRPPRSQGQAEGGETAKAAPTQPESGAAPGTQPGDPLSISLPPAQVAPEAEVDTPRTQLSKQHSFTGIDVLEKGRQAAETQAQAPSKEATPGARPKQRKGMSLNDYL